MKIFIPGGHLTPALGLIDWIQINQPQTEIVFAGRIYSQEKLKQRAVEAYEVDKRGVDFIPVKTVKFDKNNLLSWVFKPFTFFLSLMRALRILKQEDPNIIMSFGGYVAVPFVIAGWIKHIPIVAHEGTRVVGMANKIIFYFASKIAYSYSELQNYDLKKLKDKAVLTGTPLRQNIKKTANISQPEWISKFKKDQSLLLVLGGNQGSKILNDFIAFNLEQLTKNYVVVHQCGRPNNLYNYPQELTTVAKSKKIDPSRYYVLPWIDEKDLVWLYQHADLAFSRAGANTIEELIHNTLPAILVPLPSSHFNEQLKNAEYLENNKAALIIKQNDLSIENFEKKAENINKNRQLFVQQLHELKSEKPVDPAQNIFQLLMKLSKQ